MPAAKQPNRPNYTELRKQVADRLTSARRILILTHENPDADALGSALALSEVLHKLGKHVEIHLHTSGKGISSTLEFLIGQQQIHLNERLTREFLIKVDRSTSDLTSLRYEADEKGLTIFLEPGQGGIKAESISFEPGRAGFDLIVALDTDALNHLGGGAAINDHFSDVDLLVIDHHISNQDYGGINLVIPKASSTAEIVYSVIDLLDGALFTESVATQLLAGIMGDTNAFQLPNTSQRTLEIVADLVAKGADRDLVSRKLFHERSTGVLRLWGKILSNLRTESDGLAWSQLSYPDLQEEGVDEIQSGQLLNDLLSSAQDATVVLLFIEREIGRIQVSLRSPGGIDVSRFAAAHGGGGHKLAAGFVVTETSLEDLVRELLPQLHDYLKTERRGGRPNELPIAPARAAREGEAKDIFESGLSSQSDRDEGATANEASPAPVLIEEKALAEAEIEQPEEVLNDPQDYIAPEEPKIPPEDLSEADDEAKGPADDPEESTPFSATEYTAPKRNDVGVWTPDQR